jgi:phosphatidylserine/phosphatidylglycerophosphate/cardiolipin synthase-like enzyme
VFVDPNAPFVDNMRNGDSVYYQIRRLVGEADKTVDICTPYIFLSQNERDCFKKWAMEKPGRRVRVLSNSSVTSDSALAMTTFEYESAPELMREGHYRCVDPKTHEVSEGEFDNHDKKIQVYLLGRLDNMMLNKGIVKDSRGRFVLLSEFYGKLHAKFGIVDGRYSFVGSHNLDQRSKHLNSETAFFIDNPKVASVLTQEFEKAIKRSYLYGDPDLEIMNARPEIRLRKKLMTVLDFINKKFPKAGYAN